MPNQSSETDQITITRAKYNSITLYEISEDELDTIERGSPSSNYLNFSLVLLSTFISFVASLSLTDVQGGAFIFFVVITVVSGMLGLILLILWMLTKSSSRQIFNKIRSRKNVEKIRELIHEDSSQDTQSNEKP